jgi:hypothetical protein
VGRLGPAGRDYLAAGVEGDAFGAVDVLVAEQGGLPAAEGIQLLLSCFGHWPRRTDKGAFSQKVFAVEVGPAPSDESDFAE